MSWRLWHIFLVLLIGSSFAYSKNTPFKHLGLGFFFGEPTGISLGYYASDAHVINGILGWSFGKNSALLLTADYTYRGNLGISAGQLFLYAGLGVHMKFSSDIDLGVRIPLGLSYFTPQIPLEIFFELCPGMKLIPATDPFLDGGLGIRWRF
ncbi:hypothetical protein [Thermospira aquatica]|uniref:DUF3996 domain-containing protein n=1 Tax=Thermospira aquatica TaxID=2828656 RepID=A0AAX3BCN3_9SPIR|nr:hypothetical protein [Thermospira aquatica]URA10042.1 hypothetical protein KDW03_11250 [Thermospira aquatica]